MNDKKILIQKPIVVQQMIQTPLEEFVQKAFYDLTKSERKILDDIIEEIKTEDDIVDLITLKLALFKSSLKFVIKIEHFE